MSLVALRSHGIIGVGGGSVTVGADEGPNTMLVLVPPPVVRALWVASSYPGLQDALESFDVLCVVLLCTHQKMSMTKE